MRAYYDDSYTRQFEAQIIERLQIENKPAVVLDTTYFYPTGGGQPHDTGTIGTSRVIDVQSRKADNAVIHILDQPLTDDVVSCEIDWARRFDHMQQHTGQHILSQAFVQVAEANTVGFHLSADSLTIDLDRVDLSDKTINNVEDLTDQIIFEDRPVTARLIDPSDTEGIRMRRLPEALATNGLRVIDIKDFDQTACGGTHIARTGEIGLIKIVKVEKRGDKLRIEFRCGGRALNDYRDRTQVTNFLGNELTCALADIPDAVGKLREELKTAQRALKAAQQELMGYEAVSLVANAENANGYRLISTAFAERDMAALRNLANQLVQEPGIVVLLASYGAKSQVVFARSADLKFDMNAVFKGATRELGDVRGGGQPNLVQGGGGTADEAAVRRMLDTAKVLVS